MVSLKMLKANVNSGIVRVFDKRVSLDFNITAKSSLSINLPEDSAWEMRIFTRLMSLPWMMD